MLPRYQKLGLRTTSQLKHDGLHALLNEASYDDVVPEEGKRGSPGPLAPIFDLD